MKDLSRRDAIKVIGAVAGAVGIAALPDAWETPAIEAASLPVAAAASPVPTATTAPTATVAPTATAAPPTATPEPTATAAPTATAIPEILSVAITFPNPNRVVGPDPMQIMGTSTPGSVVFVYCDGLTPKQATSLTDGIWYVEFDPWTEMLNQVNHTVEATATKPPAAPAHAGPVPFSWGYPN